MLDNDRIGLSERLDVLKSNSSKEFMVYHWWFLNHEFKFQDSV